MYYGATTFHQMAPLPYKVPTFGNDLVGKMTAWKNVSALLETNCKNITQNALNDFREVLERKKGYFHF